MKGLRAMFAQDLESELSMPALWKVTRWSLDPFALGAYTEFQDALASETDREVYARPLGRLLFAGEGAVPGEVGAQCTHGAVFSGALAAVEILKRLEMPCDLEGRGPLGLDVQALVEVMATGRPRKRKRSESK